VTNAAEYIATIVRTQLGILWTHWIEHYPKRGPGIYESAETWDYVTFTWDAASNTYQHPKWEPFSKAGTEALIGEEIGV